MYNSDSESDTRLSKLKPECRIDLPDDDVVLRVSYDKTGPRRRKTQATLSGRHRVQSLERTLIGILLTVTGMEERQKRTHLLAHMPSAPVNAFNFVLP